MILSFIVVHRCANKDLNNFIYFNESTWMFVNIFVEYFTRSILDVEINTKIDILKNIYFIISDLSWMKRDRKYSDLNRS